MNRLRVKLLGNPKVLKNEKRVRFPFKKAEALFYYMVLKKEVSRDILVELLWGELGQKKARKNLRQSIYQIKKVLDLEMFLSPNRSTIKIHPQIDLKTDVETFLEKKEKVEEYGEFLEGFYVKNAQGFENWMQRYRQMFKDRYIKNLKLKMDQAYEDQNFSIVTFYGKKLIVLDELDEEVYQILMKSYRDQGKVHKALKVYEKLQAVYLKELGIDPSEESKNMYQTLFEQNKKTIPIKHSEYSYERECELQKMQKSYEQFLKDEKFKMVLILGQAGIGKTVLKDEFIKTIHKNTWIIQTQCYQAQMNDWFKPFNTIFEQLLKIIQDKKIKIPILWKKTIHSIFPNLLENESLYIHSVERIDGLHLQVIEEIFMICIEKIASYQKMILVFEDLQWMDDKSLSLIAKMMIQNQNIFFIGTCRRGYEQRLDSYINFSYKDTKVQKIGLYPFNYDEIQKICVHWLPQYPFTDKILHKIYYETQGNPFFLQEVLRNIEQTGQVIDLSTKIESILKNRWMELSNEERKMLEWMALFFDCVDLKMLENLTQQSILEMMERLEGLEDKGILKQVVCHGEIGYRFVHKKFQEYIIHRQSPTKIKILHNQIGHILEKKLYQDYRDHSIYSQLIYHFKNAENDLATLTYEIKNFDRYFNIIHELFPMLQDEGMKQYKASVGFKKGDGVLKELENKLIEITKKYKNIHNIQRLKIQFLHMKGRYLIQKGAYEEGIKAIQSMILLARKICHREYALKGYRQMIYYGIQTYQVEVMHLYIEESSILCKEYDDEKNLGILLRLKGLCQIMKGEYRRAEKNLRESIKIFEQISIYEDQYTLNIAAAYDYLGEIRRCQMKFLESIRYDKQAISICEDKKVIKGRSIFYTHMGQAALDIGEDDLAMSYLSKAIELYDQVKTLWSRSIAEGYMALLKVKQESYNQGLVHLKKAIQYAWQLKSPYELGVMYRVKAQVKVLMKDHINLQKVFGHLLKKSITYYCDQGTRHLKKLNHPYELDIIQLFRKYDKIPKT